MVKVSPTKSSHEAMQVCRLFYRLLEETSTREKGVEMRYMLSHITRNFLYHGLIPQILTY